MARHAHGTFEVQLTPQPLADADAAPGFGRLAIAKVFRGDIAGSSRGEMLSLQTSVEGSAGYVAIEQVTGTLHDLPGSFALQHSGTMAHGVQQLTITVVPDSGTGELAGLAGTMSLEIADGVHSYALAYTLPADA